MENSVPLGIDPVAWAEAVTKARGDRARLARLVASGSARRVRGVWQLPLPALPARGSDTIRPSKRNKRRK